VSTDLEKSSGFWDQRTGWRRLKETMLLEPLPGGARWAAAFGSLLLFAFVVQVVTGVLLTMNYAPSDKTAWASVKFIQEDVPLGAFIRALHHWGSSAMVILLLLHLVQVFVWGAYKRPREFTWMVGVLLLGCTLGLAFTGYLLPWDQKAYWATKVGVGIASTVPVIGDDLRLLLQGGPQMGNLTLTRFFAMHGFVLPGLLILLTVVHLYQFRLHGVTPAWGKSAEQLKAEEEPFWPDQVWKDGVLALVFLLGLGVWCYYQPAPLEAHADPAQAYEARPEWYFMFLFQLLRYFHGPYEIVGTFVLPTLFFLILFFWPFLDRNPDRNPRRRPIAMTLLTGGTAGLIGMTAYAIATDVRMREPALAVEKAPPPKEPAGQIQFLDVAKLYSGNCAACHGLDGSGKQIRGGMPTIPDFTSLAWQMSQTDLEITHRILDGNEPLMPAFRDKLSRDQNLALTIYVRAFAITLPTPTAAKPAPVPPAAVSAQMAPAQVYRAYCLACHDSDGKGNIVRKLMTDIPDFTDAKWQASRPKADLAQSILDGKGKFMLPMKDKLGGTDVDQMVAYVQAFQGGRQSVGVEPKRLLIPPALEQPTVASTSPSTPNQPRTIAPGAENAVRIRAASVLFREYCLSCHGPDGRGTEIRSRMPDIPDFTSRPWQEVHNNPQLTVSILDGKGSLMPAFRGRVSDDRARDLVAYLRAFNPVPMPVSQVPANEFEERFRQLEDQWNRLQKELKESAPPKQ
jgi:quinol-cytochrome oxidoreductase complex cytochrome b subunit/mono/diheme cytochrome c family protein